MDQEQTTLELRAYLALQGASGTAGSKGDWRNDVTAALRSNAPLSPHFREALATAIDGDLSGFGLGFRLELVADNGEKKRRQDVYGGAIVRREYMKVGGWMREQISLGSTRAKAVTDSGEYFGASPDKCDKALIYYDKAMAWVKKMEAGETWNGFSWTGFEKIGVCPTDALLSIYHWNAANGHPPDAA